MILHFEDEKGERLNVNFDKHIYNDLNLKVFFTVKVSNIDFYQIMEELDFDSFNYDVTDETISGKAGDPVPDNSLPFH